MNLKTIKKFVAGDGWYIRKIAGILLFISAFFIFPPAIVRILFGVVMVLVAVSIYWWEYLDKYIEF